MISGSSINSSNGNWIGRSLSDSLPWLPLRVAVERWAVTDIYGFPFRRQGESCTSVNMAARYARDKAWREPRGGDSQIRVNLGERGRPRPRVRDRIPIQVLRQQRKDGGG